MIRLLLNPAVRTAPWLNVVSYPDIHTRCSVPRLSGPNALSWREVRAPSVENPPAAAPPAYTDRWDEAPR